MKRFELSLLIALAVCIAAAIFQIPYSRNSQTLRDSTLRLHVVANSDSEQDQAVKLQVRDALLKHSELLFAQNDATVAQAQALVTGHLSELEQTANAVLRENGLDYIAHAKLTTMFFERRDYGGITLPAGTYAALRVELGEAEGKNWWCVIYPSLCLPAASAKEMDNAFAHYTQEELDILENSDRYVIRFQLEEWFQQLKSRSADETA